MCKSWLPALAENAKENAENPRIATWAVVNKEAVEEIKKEKLIGEKSCSFISTNDIIVAGISEVATASITCVMMNMRGRVQNLGPERACNGERVCMLPREKIINNPVYLRSKIINSGRFSAFDSGEMNEDAFHTGPLTGTSNWCSLTKHLSFEGSELMVHLAPGFFTTEMPFDMNVMFEADTAGTIGLVHNMRNTASFKERVAKSAIFRRIFKYAS